MIIHDIISYCVSLKRLRVCILGNSTKLIEVKDKSKK